MEKKITITLSGEGHKIGWDDNVTATEILGLLTFYQKWVFVKMHRQADAQELKKQKTTKKK